MTKAEFRRLKAGNLVEEALSGGILERARGRTPGNGPWLLGTATSRREVTGRDGKR